MFQPSIFDQPPPPAPVTLVATGKQPFRPGSQCDLLYRIMEKGRYVSPFGAETMNITQFHTRLHEMRKKGLQIVQHEVQSRTGIAHNIYYLKHHEAEIKRLRPEGSAPPQHEREVSEVRTFF